eukprot:1138156-Pelagomonas_calceolata.AAC.6
MCIKLTESACTAYLQKRKRVDEPLLPLDRDVCAPPLQVDDWIMLFNTISILVNVAAASGKDDGGCGCGDEELLARSTYDGLPELQQGCTKLVQASLEQKEGRKTNIQVGLHESCLKRRVCDGGTSLMVKVMYSYEQSFRLNTKHVHCEAPRNYPHFHQLHANNMKLAKLQVGGEGPIICNTAQSNAINPSNTIHYRATQFCTGGKGGANYLQYSIFQGNIRQCSSAKWKGRGQIIHTRFF